MKMKNRSLTLLTLTIMALGVAGYTRPVAADAVSVVTERPVSASQYIVEYPIPTPNSAPLAITVDNNMIVWFTESNASKLGRFDPAKGTFTEYDVPGIGDMWGAAVDKTGYIWVTQYSAKGSVSPGGTFASGGHGRLVRFDPVNKSFRFVDIPTNSSFPMRIIVDPQNRIWFTEFLGNKIGVYDQSSDHLEEYSVPSNYSGPADLAFDSRSTLWFTEAYNHSIANFSPENKSFVEYHFEAELLSPVGISTDHEGRVWVADHGGNWIAEFDPDSGQLIRYPTHTPPENIYPFSIPNGLLIDRQGRVWFSEHLGNSIAFYDPVRNRMTEFAIPTGPITTPLWIALSPNGELWFAEYDANKIGVVHPTLLVPVSLRISQANVRLPTGGETAFSIVVNTSQEIAGNGTFRYSWSSFSPNDLSVKFSSQYPSLSGLGGSPTEAKLKLSASVKPGNYTLGLGIDAGTVSVWGMINVEVVSAQTKLEIFSLSTTISLAVIALVLVATGAYFYQRGHHKTSEKSRLKS